MTDIADTFQIPKDLPGLCWEMYDTIAAIPTHMVPRQYGNGATWRSEHEWLECCLILRSCYIQRLEQLGIERPIAKPTTGEYK